MLAVKSMDVRAVCGTFCNGKYGAKIRGLSEPSHGAAESGEQSSGNRQADRKRCAAGRSETDSGNCQSHPSGIPSAERIPQG